MGCTSSKEIEASNNSSKGKVEEAVVLRKNPLPVIPAQPVVANNVSNNSSLRKIVARPKVLSVGCEEDTLEDGQCVIAIDFGTSRSAYAYGFSGQVNTKIIVNVPDNAVLDKGQQLKSETTLLLDSKFKAVGFGQKGRQEFYERGDKQMYLFQWFKMGLKEIQNDQDDIMIADHENQQVSLMVVITQALYLLSSAALGDINKVFHSNLKPFDVHWVITVPAIWTVAATGFMRQAAMNAGMIPHKLSRVLTLVKEPEGACYDLLDQIANGSGHGNSIQIGTEMAIVDCGGGTNDMTFVRVLSTQPLSLEEVKEPAGGTAGAAEIDVQMKNLIKAVIGAHNFKQLSSQPSFVNFMDGWERLKAEFNGDLVFAIDLNTLVNDYEERTSTQLISEADMAKFVADYNNTQNSEITKVTTRKFKFTAKAEFVRMWFDNVVLRIIGELREQLEMSRCRNVNFLYMVGGFSSSPYLRSKIEEFVLEFNRGRSTQIEIHNALHADLAIVSGAVVASLKRAQPLIQNRIICYSAGIISSKVYDAKEHKDATDINTVNGTRRVKVLLYYVLRQTTVPANYVTEEKSFWPLTEEQEIITFQYYTIDDESITMDTIVYQNDPRVRKIMEFSTPVDRTKALANRQMLVSLKIGLETQFIVKSKDGKPCEGTTKFFK